MFTSCMHLANHLEAKEGQNLTLDQIEDLKVETRKLDKRERVAGKDDQNLRGLVLTCLPSKMIIPRLMQ